MLENLVRFLKVRMLYSKFFSNLSLNIFCNLLSTKIGDCFHVQLAARPERGSHCQFFLAENVLNFSLFGRPPPSLASLRSARAKHSEAECKVPTPFTGPRESLPRYARPGVGGPSGGDLTLCLAVLVRLFSPGVDNRPPVKKRREKVPQFWHFLRHRPPAKDLSLGQVLCRRPVP